MVEDTHQDHELEGAWRQSLARGARGQEIVEQQLGGAGDGLGQLAPGRGEQGGVGVDAGVAEGEPRLIEEAGEARVAAADVEDGAERSPAGGVDRTGGEQGEEPLPARPGARAATAIEGVRMRLVEGPIDIEKLLAGRRVHGRRESRARCGARPRPGPPPRPWRPFAVRGRRPRLRARGAPP